MSEPTVTPSSTVIVTGSADAPAFKRRPMLLVLALVGYAAFLTLLVVWALKLRQAQ